MFIRNSVLLKYQDEHKSGGVIQLSKKNSYSANIPLPKGTKRLANGDVVPDMQNKDEAKPIKE